ncbi:MAG TPA: peptidylprolyl isomerase [Verrucomicrobiae bacterium]|nr:peptidylprolyl isomerase [Verrucomicrobiae bacterium]
MTGVSSKRALLMAVAALAAAQQSPKRPDGLYAEIKTSKGLIVARLEMDLVPMTVANFVGLAEGTIANAAFDPGRPFYDGTTWHRVEAGHVIQTGVPKSDRSRGPGYTFPNEIHAKLSHNHLGALNMANSGPNTNAAQFCIMLGDRSYLDGDYTVFGDTVEGLDVVKRVERGDPIESIRIVRVGAKAEAFHPTTESFQAMVKAAQARATEHAEKKIAAEREWIANTYPHATGPKNGVLTEELMPPREGAAASAVMQVKYRGKVVRYKGLVIGWNGPLLVPTDFASGENGVPGFEDAPHAFTFEVGKTKINPGLDGVIAGMRPGERKLAIVPAALGYGRMGTYPPEIPGHRRFVVSPNALLVYEIEVD